MHNIVVTVVGALLIFNALKIVIPEGSMKKYISHIMSVFMIVVIITPIMGAVSLTLPEISVDYPGEDKSDALSDLQLRQILANYEKQLIEDFKRSVPTLFDGLREIEIGFFEDSSQYNFGMVKSLEIKSARERDERVIDKLYSLYGIEREVIKWEKV